jgi:hypothetical protein
MSIRTYGFAIAALAALAPAATGQDWIEIGDAPEFPAGCGQPVTGTGMVGTISGATSTGDDDFVDAYLIDIVNPRKFYATTTPAMDPRASASWNTRLFLFDSDGTPVLANDDAPNAGAGQSYLGSPGTFVGPTGPTVSDLDAGRYVLVVSGWANDPVDGDGAWLFDLSSVSIALVGPQPAAGPFQHWENSHGLVQSGEYVIALQGVGFITEVTEPCPADVNCDLVVDVDDLTDVILQWGTDDPATDINGSGDVDIDDLVAVLLAWGVCR